MRTFLRAITWVWAATWAVAGLAQAPLAKPNLPLLVNGTVRAVAPLADGSVVIGGAFSMVNSVPRTPWPSWGRTERSIRTGRRNSTT